MADEIMTVKELCLYLKLKRSTVYEMVKNDKIPFIRRGKKILRFRKSRIDEWLKSFEHNCDERMRILESIR